MTLIGDVRQGGVGASRSSWRSSSAPSVVGLERRREVFEPAPRGGVEAGRVGLHQPAQRPHPPVLAEPRVLDGHRVDELCDPAGIGVGVEVRVGGHPRLPIGAVRAAPRPRSSAGASLPKRVNNSDIVTLPSSRVDLVEFESGGADRARGHPTGRRPTVSRRDRTEIARRHRPPPPDPPTAATGGAPRSRTRCTSGRSPMPTVTVSATSRGCARGCRTSPRSASTRCGSTRGTRRRRPTAATTSPTTATSSRRSARSTTDNASSTMPTPTASG